MTIHLGNFRFEDDALDKLPSVGDKADIGKTSSFKTSAIGEGGEPLPVLVTYTIGMKVDVETEADIDARLSSIETSIANLEADKAKKLADKATIETKVVEGK